MWMIIRLYKFVLLRIFFSQTNEIIISNLKTGWWVKTLQNYYNIHIPQIILNAVIQYKKYTYIEVTKFWCKQKQLNYFLILNNS